MRNVVQVFLAMAVAFLLVTPALAQQPADRQATTPPLVQLLQAKGILTPEEATQISAAASAEEANAKLAQVLVSKGLISQQEYVNTVGATGSASASSAAAPSGKAHLLSALFHSTPSEASDTTLSSDPFTYGAPGQEGSVIPAVAPLRVLPIDVPKQGGLIPDLQLGSGAKMKLYGFFKVSAVEDTASSGGAQNGVQDFPLPLLLGDTGPKGDPYFLMKARSFRIGSQFEWVPKGSDLTITGKLETDYEGDYTAVNNRSISSVRSSQLSLRLAYVRLDTHLYGLPVFAEFGQDWTLNSSTLPNIFETTGLMVFYGALYERAPMFKTGVQFSSGDFKVQPEFAVVLPVSSDSNLSILQREGFGDRAGAESNQPAVEGRIVFQFPLSHSWKAVPPAQIIFSGSHANNNEVVTHGNSLSIPIASTFNLGTLTTGVTAGGGSTGLPTAIIPGATNCAEFATQGGCSIAQAFPHGLQEQYPQNVWTAEVQLPTPWVTFAAKYYNGDDLRFFFGGQLNTVWENLAGVPQIEIPVSSVGIVAGAPGIVTENVAASATSFSGQSILFGCTGFAVATGCPGTSIVASGLEPVRGQGGFAEMTFPLSRIFHADPEGRNAGWTFHVLYGTDRTNADDARHTGGNGLARSDYDTANLSWKINKWVSFVNEITYMQTQAAKNDSKLFRGVDSTKAHDIREEFGTVVVF